MTKLTPERLAEIRTNAGSLNKGGFWYGHAIEDLLAHIDAIEAGRDAMTKDREDWKHAAQHWMDNCQSIGKERDALVNAAVNAFVKHDWSGIREALRAAGRLP